jgi:bifunctional non-homologous end joining protein LigD
MPSSCAWMRPGSRTSLGCAGGWSPAPAPRSSARGAAPATPATLMIFDVLWHEGEGVWRRCYDERRAVLDALALDGPSWRTPPRFCAARDDLAAVTRDHQLEGVVAKRRDAPYEPGRRSGAWIKFKHWRRERLHAIAWLPAQGASGRDGLLVARVDEHRELSAAGVVQLGLAGDRRTALHQLAGAAHADRRLPLAGVLVDVDHHGPRGGPLRDAVLREVHATA